MRKCIEVMAGGFRCRGTVHVPISTQGFEGLGVVILHPGFLPRSGLGDGFVALAEGLTANGVLTVRIDLPGLGDSEGHLPEVAVEFFHQVQEGQLAPLALECVDQVRAQLGLKKVILGGLCGGAITGLFALASSRESWVEGMFAVETLFNLVLPAEAPLKGEKDPLRETLRDVRHVLYEQTRKAILKTPLGTPIKNAYRAVRGVSDQPTAGSAPGSLPPEANTKLIRCVDQVLEGTLPLLFVTADQPQKSPEPHFDYLDHILAKYPDRANRIRVFGTDHAFLAGDGTPRLIEHINEWISAQFREQNVELLGQNAG